MEELTIGDKTYISSKRAAEITGYAKDYIGQLCREGRVSATLVGRSWYVLESAIREHRFGAAADTRTTTPAENARGIELESTWSAPKYTHEEVSYISRTPEGSIVRPGVDLLTQAEPLIRQEPEENISNDMPRVENDPNVLVEMQSAWQDWFKQRELPAPEEQPVIETAEVEEATPVAISSLPPEPQYQPVEEEEVATAVELRIQHEEQPEAVLDVVEVAEEIPRIVYEAPVRSSYIPRALLLVAAGAAVLVAVIGTGSLDFIARQHGIQASAINFIAGIQQYQKPLK